MAVPADHVRDPRVTTAGPKVHVSVTYDFHADHPARSRSQGSPSQGSRPLSSTTDRRRDERGQILVIFAGGLVLILAVAALVFDVGQNLLDRRTEQNVSDAASLAGAQYLSTAGYTFHGFCSAAPGGMPAVQAACDVASESGYVDGTDGRTVRVDLPPVAPHLGAGIPGYIQVTIGSSRPSFFAGVLGMETQNVGAMAVAKSDGEVPLPYSLLALDPHGMWPEQDPGCARVKRLDEWHRAHRLRLHPGRAPPFRERRAQFTPMRRGGPDPDLRWCREQLRLGAVRRPRVGGSAAQPAAAATGDGAGERRAA